MPLPSMAGFEGNGWALAGVLMVMLCAWAIRQLVPWKQAETEAQKAESEIEHKRFTEGQEHIRVLQEENKGLRQHMTSIEDGWRDRMANLEKEYDEHRRECRKETEDLHAMVRKLNDEVVGLRRLIAQNSQSTANMLGDIGNG